MPKHPREFERRLLSWPQVVEKFGGITEQTLRRLFFDHYVPEVRIGSRVMFDEADLDDLIDKLKH